MAHAFGSPSFSINPYRSAPEFEASSNFGTNRVFLVAIHGGVLAPQDRNTMQRMRVVVLPANQPGEFNSSELLPGLFQQPLPPMAPALPMVQQKRLQPRPVRGEILRDQEGRLYEKIGEQIRPLNKLVSGSGGQVLELVRSRGPISKTHAPVENNAPADFQKAQDANPPGSPRQKQTGEFGRAGPATRRQEKSLLPTGSSFPIPDRGA